MVVRKYLLISLPDVEEVEGVSYELLEKLYIKYRREGILYGPIMTVLLYAGAISDRNLRSILEFERKRLRDVKRLSKIFGIPERDVMAEVIEGVAERLGLQLDVSVSKKAHSVTMSLPVAIAFGIEPDARMIVRKGIIVMSLEKGYDAVVEAYINTVENIIREEREELIQMFSNIEPVKGLVEKYFREVSNNVGRKVEKLPPCVENILDGNVEPGSRNTALVSMVHLLKFLRKEFRFKVSDEELENLVREANSKFPEPLPEREVENIIKYHIHTYRDKIYNACSMIRREAPELCPYGDHKECWRELLSGRSKKRPQPFKRKSSRGKYGEANGRRQRTVQNVRQR